MGIDTEKLSKLLTELRKSKHLTQKELGSFLGVTDKTISKWETGVAIPDSFYLPTLSKIFDITIDELLSGEIKPKDLKSKLNIEIVYMLILSSQQLLNLLFVINQLNALGIINSTLGLIFSVFSLIITLIKKDNYLNKLLYTLFFIFYILNFIISLILIFI